MPTVVTHKRDRHMHGYLAIEPDVLDKMIELRRQIHRLPELSHKENATRGIIQEALISEGLANFHPVTETGFSVDILGERNCGGRSIAIRADMDALPIQEQTRLPFRSEIDGVMHACGHDTHSAMAFAAAAHLNRNRAAFSGLVRILFQHSEEDLPSGAKQFLDAGRLDDCDAVLGIHVDPELPAGKIAVRAGTYACSSDHFDIAVAGRSCHGGKPHQGVDAIGAACSLVCELTKIRSHNTSPLVPLVVTVGMVSGGTAPNIISDRALIRGTIRAGDEEVRKVAHKRVTELANGVALMHGASCTIAIMEDAPVLINDAGMAELVQRTAREIGGQAALEDAPMWTASDDFAYLSADRPGVYFRLGVRNAAKNCDHPLHHPLFSVDEDALSIGAAVLARAAETYLLTE